MNLGELASYDQVGGGAMCMLLGSWGIGMRRVAGSGRGIEEKLGGGGGEKGGRGGGRGGWLLCFALVHGMPHHHIRRVASGNFS